MLPSLPLALTGCLGSRDQDILVASFINLLSLTNDLLLLSHLLPSPQPDALLIRLPRAPLCGRLASKVGREWENELREGQLGDEESEEDELRNEEGKRVSRWKRREKRKTREL